MTKKLPIGVFDSGVGGISVLKELVKLMPNENYIYFGDTQNAPYGIKSSKEIKEYTQKAISELIKLGAKAIVIACNTATSIAACEIRQKYDIPIIGIEPAVKPAVIAHPNGKVAVMATPMTLKKEKFLNLMESYKSTAEIIPLPCPGLVEIIERGITKGNEIDNYLNLLFSPFSNHKINAIVLGCTHYPHIKDSIRNFFDYDIDIIDGGYGTAKETKRRLECENLINPSHNPGRIIYKTSSDNSNDIEIMKKLANS